jgi:hypothetical protein
MDTSEKDKKCLGNFETWCWRRMEISWTDHVKNELHTVKKERNILHTKKEGGLTGWATSCIGSAF